MKKKALLLGLMASMFIAGCGSTNKPASSSEPAPESSEPEPEQEYVNVFVLSGQSNMEGNTSFKSGSTDLLDNAMKELGYDDGLFAALTLAEALAACSSCGWAEAAAEGGSHRIWYRQPAEDSIVWL